MGSAQGLVETKSEDKDFLTVTTTKTGGSLPFYELLSTVHQRSDRTPTQVLDSWSVNVDSNLNFMSPGLRCGIVWWVVTVYQTRQCYIPEDITEYTDAKTTL
jgi:hypothetical protein